MKNMKEKSLFEKIIIGVYILSAITCVIAVIYMLADKYTHQRLESGIFIALSIELLMIIILNTTRLVQQIFIESQNLKKCNIPVFDEIDNFRKRFKYGNDKKSKFYEEQVEIINLYYEKGGKVDQCIADEGIQCLYKRYDFLTTHKKIIEEMYGLGTSLVISILASLILEFGINTGSNIIGNIFIVVIAVNFLLVIFSRYAIKSQMNSYRHMIEECELKRLNEKIDSMERKMECTDGDVLIAKQVILTELCKKKKRRKKKEKEELIRKIEEIEQLDVCLKRNGNLKKYEYEVNGEKIYLAYHPDEKENENYNETDKKLYDIMNEFLL